MCTCEYIFVYIYIYISTSTSTLSTHTFSLHTHTPHASPRLAAPVFNLPCPYSLEDPKDKKEEENAGKCTSQPRRSKTRGLSLMLCRDERGNREVCVRLSLCVWIRRKKTLYTKKKCSRKISIYASRV